MSSSENPLASLSEDEVRILPADFTLKKLIGEDVNIHALLSPENVEKAQQVINEHKDSFLEWVSKDIESLEEAFSKLQAHLGEHEPHLKKLARIAFVIKSQAGTFGFSLATQIAKSLDDFCARHFKPTPEHMTVLRKHIDALALIFRQHITGEGGDAGHELAGSLSKLVEKYS